MRIRAYQPGDEAAMAALLNAAEGVYGAEPYYTAEAERDEMGSRVKDPERDSRLTFTDDGELVSYGTVMAAPADGERAGAYGGVHPDHLGRGLGRQLLGWQLDRLREMHAEQGADRPWQVSCGASHEDKGAARLYERFGLLPTRYFLEMRADLPTGVDPVPAPDGLRLEPFAGELARPVYDAYTESFADHWGHEDEPYEEFVAAMYEASTFRPDLSVVARAGDEVAGFVLALDGVGGTVNIDLVGTRRAWRRRGLAAAMLGASLAAATAAGKENVKLGVDADSPTGAVGVYERAGFAKTHTFVSFRGPLH